GTASSSRWRMPTRAFGGLIRPLNHRPFRKRDGSRASVFEARAKPALYHCPTRDPSRSTRTAIGRQSHHSKRPGPHGGLGYGVCSYSARVRRSNGRWLTSSTSTPRTEHVRAAPRALSL